MSNDIDAASALWLTVGRHRGRLDSAACASCSCEPAWRITSRPEWPGPHGAALERLGVEVIVPRSQTCCGQPGWSAGHPDQARQVARQALRAFAGTDPVVVPSGSCAAMVTHGYPELFAGQPEEAAANALAGRTYELTQFIRREGLDPHRRPRRAGQS